MQSYVTNAQEIKVSCHLHARKKWKMERLFPTLFSPGWSRNSGKKMSKCSPMYLVVYYFAHQGVEFEGKVEHLFK